MDLTRDVRLADLFCGAGGTSTGACDAARALGLTPELVCVNHWAPSIATHRLNHPEARHHCISLDAAEPDQLVPERRLDLLMASPTCTQHSSARLHTPLSEQQRADPWHVVRWATVLDVGAILIENVRQFVHWGPLDPATSRPIEAERGRYFEAWTAALRGIGYTLDWRVLNAADYGDPTTRERFFLMARKDGHAIRWPEATHAPRDRAPLAGLRPWADARSVVDLDRPARSLLDPDRRLKASTLGRLLNGAERLGWPAPFRRALADRIAGRPPARAEAGRPRDAAPTLAAQTPAPFLIGQHGGSVARGLDAPLMTIATKGVVRLAQGRLDRLTPGEDPGFRPTVALPGGLFALDVTFRTLDTDELARAMSFVAPGRDYRFHGNEADVKKQIGNAVPVETAKALTRAMLKPLAAARRAA